MIECCGIGAQHRVLTIKRRKTESLDNSYAIIEVQITAITIIPRVAREKKNALGELNHALVKKEREKKKKYPSCLEK